MKSGLGVSESKISAVMKRGVHLRTDDILNCKKLTRGKTYRPTDFISRCLPASYQAHRAQKRCYVAAEAHKTVKTGSV